MGSERNARQAPAPRLEVTVLTGVTDAATDVSRELEVVKAPRAPRRLPRGHDRRLPGSNRRRDPRCPAGAIRPAVVLAFAAYTALPDIAAVGAAVGATGGSIAGLAGAIAKRRHELASQRRENKFLFLHGAGRHLG